MGPSAPVLLVHDSWERDLVSDWEALLAEDPEAGVFCTPTWLRAWWETLGGGRLRLAAVREGGRLLAVFPLCAGDDLSFLGDDDVTDEQVFCARPGCEARALRCLLEWALDEGCVRLTFAPIREPSRWPAILAGAAAAFGLAFTTFDLDVSPAIALPPTWADYLAGLPAHDRQELGRKRRRLDDLGAWRARRVDAPAAGAALASFVSLHRLSPGDKGDFFTPPRERFFHRLAGDLYAQGRARLDVLEVGDQPVAWTFGYDYRDGYGLYNSSFRRELAAHAPGMVLVGCLIEGAIAAGKRRFDFLRGAEGYKRRFGVCAHPVRRLVLAGRS